MRAQNRQPGRPFGRSASLIVVLGVSAVQSVSAEERACTLRLAELARLLDAPLSQHSASQIHGRIEGGRISISCPLRASQPTITLSYPSEYPPKSFYDVIGRVTASAAAQQSEVMELRAHRCHRAAKRTRNGHTQKSYGSLRIACDRGVSHSTFTIHF